MVSWSKALTSGAFDSCSLFSSLTYRPLHFFLCTSSSPAAITQLVASSGFSAPTDFTSTRLTQSYLYPSICKKKATNPICRAAEYKFPDPIPNLLLRRQRNLRPIFTRSS